MTKISFYKKTGTTILGLILLFVLVFFVQKQVKKPQEVRDVNLSLKWLHQTQFAGMYMAQDKGWYRKKGLNVHFKEFSFEKKPIADLQDGTADIAMASVSEFLDYYSKDPEIIAIAAIYQVSPFAVVSLEGHGLTSPRDLAGKVLGVKGGPGAEAEITYEILLESAGLSVDDVSIKYLNFDTNEREDLLSEEIDAIGLYRTRVDQHEFGVVLLRGRLPARGEEFRTHELGVELVHLAAEGADGEFWHRREFARNCVKFNILFSDGGRIKI